MACTTLNNILKTCDNNQGGVFQIYVNDTYNCQTTINSASHSISALSVSGASFSTFQFNRNVGHLDVEPKIDLINGSTYYEAKVTLHFNRREAVKSRALTILAEGQRFLDLIIGDANGIYWYVDHAQLNGGAETTGTNRADGSKYEVTFIAQMNTRPLIIDLSLVTPVINIVSSPTIPTGNFDGNGPV